MACYKGIQGALSIFLPPSLPCLSSGLITAFGSSVSLDEQSPKPGKEAVGYSGGVCKCFPNHALKAFLPNA